MMPFLRSVFRHYRLPTLGRVMATNVLALAPLVAGLAAPLLLTSTPEWGLAAFLLAFVLLGQILAVVGRGPGKPLVTLWKAAWVEGLFVTILFLGAFSLLFQSLPYYAEQGSWMGALSVVTLCVGSGLVLAFLPYVLPARRREGLGLVAALRRAVGLMNRFPGTALAGLGLTVLASVATLATVGLFPGLVGIAVLHQGLWDHVREREEALTPS